MIFQSTFRPISLISGAKRVRSLAWWSTNSCRLMRGSDVEPQYIKQRYGSPHQAKEFWLRNNAY